MIVTVFRSRLMPGVRDDYVSLVDRMVELAATMPGYISHKGFFADDGERVTIVEFESEEAQRAWRMHAGTPRRAAQGARRSTIDRTAFRFARLNASRNSTATRTAWRRE